jgi:hypothetical protein
MTPNRTLNITRPALILTVRVIVWLWCFASIMSNVSTAHKMWSLNPSAFQETSVASVCLFEAVTSFFIAYILDKPLSIPWQLHMQKLISARKG